MIALSESARKSLDDYLRQARAYLRGARTVDADEVEQNITEHIETALQGAGEPVSRVELEAVLDKLGDPKQWVPEEELPWWRQMVLRLRTGPEDWRLAYLSFGLFVSGLLIFTAAPVLIVASYLVSRATISESPDPKELKAQRWLIYPSMILVHFLLFVCLLLWPLAWFRLVIGAQELAILGLWWIILCATLAKWRKLQSIFVGPFGISLKRKWILIFLLAGLALMVLSVWAAYLFDYRVWFSI